MPIFESWAVVKVPFPYTNRVVRQNRPALVIATPIQKTGPDLLWVLMITSLANRAWEGDIPITDLPSAGLPVACVIRSSKIAAIESREAEALGSLSSVDRLAVADYLTELMKPLHSTLKE